MRARILHTIDSEEPGGAEQIFMDLLSGLDPERFQSIAAVPGGGWLSEQLAERGIEAVEVPSQGSFHIRYLRALVGLIRTHRIDLIQSHLFGSNVYSSLAGILTRTPVVSTFHGEMDVDPRERLLAVKMGILGTCTGTIVAVSEGLGKYVRDRSGLPVSKIRTIYNGIDTDRFHPGRDRTFRDQYGIGDSAPVLCSVGHLRPGKGYEELVEAAGLLKGSLPDLRVLIAGDTSHSSFEGLKAAVSRLGLEQTVLFTGNISDPAPLYRNSDIFLLPSLSEGFSLSTIEAMATSLPVIATKSGGPEEIVSHGVDGLLIEKGSPQAIADAVLRLSQKPAWAIAIGEKARERVMDSFSFQAMIGGYEREYANFLTN